MTPEVQLIAISRPDGGVSIMHFVTKQQRSENDPGWTREATDEAIEAEIAKSGKGDHLGWRRIKTDDIPADRSFREAWAHDLTVDMDKARDIYKGVLRQARAPLLQALDVEYQRADERADAAAKQSVAAQKQALRDVTADPAIAAAKTPDDLKAVWPTALGQRAS
jgi:hypothetical protein